MALREAVRCRAGAVQSAGVWYGPGSAKQRFAKGYALHRARDTRPSYTCRSTIIILSSAMASEGLRLFGQALAQFMMVWQR